MAVDITKPLRQALAKLESEQARLARQVSAIRSVLGSGDGRTAARPARRRRRMSPAARKAVSQRMKAYWAARRNKKSKKA